jgi:thiol-disulfide isomerase/thioredoxin
MGKADRNRKQSARERIAAQQAAAKRAEARRRMFIGGGSVLAVLAVVVALIIVHVAGESSSSGSTVRTALPASVLHDVNNVPASVMAAVGTGSVLKYSQTPITKITGAALTENGKPEMLYIGAEFCPYCAAMRWSMAVALSKFGTMSPLSGIHSSSTDTDPSTPTLTFYKSSYSSKYLTFTPVENEDVNRHVLQATTAAQTALWVHYEPGGTQDYPFIDFGNKTVVVDPMYDPAVLAKMTWAQVAAALHDPSSAVAQGAIGAANYITAAICNMTNNQPSTVCSASPTSSLEKGL